jgi:hypothetical protein
MTFEDSLVLMPNAIFNLTKPTFELVTNFQPTCQVLTVKKVSIDGGPTRFKIILSDGIHSVQAVLAFKCNWIATKLCSNDIIEITDYNSIRNNNNNFIIIIQDLYVKHPDINDVVGQPIPFILGAETFISNKVYKYNYDQPSPTPTTSSCDDYGDEERIIIDDWTILTNGSVIIILPIQMVVR